MKLVVLVIGLATFSACSSKPEVVAPPVVVKPTPPKPPSPTSLQGMAKRILHHPKIKLMRGHVSGKVDTATAYHNILHTSRGQSARRSYYGNAPGGYTKLDARMLKTMLYMADTKGWSFSVTSIAGISHSRTSRHYRGVAFDVNYINGVKVGAGKPYYREFMRIARSRGATEVLGPGDRAHSGHIHLAW